MIYIIEGEEELFIKDKINQIANQVDCEVIKFDGNDKNFSLANIIDACNSSSLFAQRNAVLVKDAPFLCKKFDEKELIQLSDYVANPVFETDLVFYTYENKYNSKLKAYKNVATNAQILKYNSYDYKNFNTYVNQEVRRNNLNINNDAVTLLNQICKCSATLLNQNIEILINYPDKITTQVVSMLCSSSDDNDSFELINAITSKDISKVIFLERKIFNDSNNIYAVIGLLASQLRFLYRLAYLLDCGKKRVEILDELNISDYRYNKSKEALNKLNMKMIVNMLQKLSQLDILCKSDTSLSEQVRFEIFILQLLGKDTYASH